MTVTQLNADLIALLDEVEAGEEIEITRRGVVVARLTPKKELRRLKGALTGVAASAARDEYLFTTGAWT